MDHERRAGRLALVTGATGMVGPRVVEAFRQAGFAVRTLSNTPPDPSPPADVEVRTGDITDAAAIRAAVEGVTVVVHLAALLHLRTPRRRCARRTSGPTSVGRTS